MRIPSFLNRFLNSRSLWISSGISLLMAFLLFRWQGSLADALSQLTSEYQMDLNLSNHKAEHLQVYQTVLSAAKLPEDKSLNSNAWIQTTQAMVVDQKLSLEELKPIYDQKKKGAKKNSLFLVVECRMTDLLGFLHRVAKGDDFVYVEQLSVAVSSEGSDLVRAQMVLSQMGVR